LRTFWREGSENPSATLHNKRVASRQNAMLASLSLGFAFVLPPTPATTRLTAHDRMPPPMAMLTRDADAQRRLPRICSTPEAVRAATPPYAAARTLHTPH